MPVEPSYRRASDTVSSCLGITIRMYYNDHLPPHFHAEHGDDEVLGTINPVGIYEGSLPTRSLRLVLAWAELHQTALEANWNAARAMQCKSFRLFHSLFSEPL